jgi:hypothetical protein
MGKTVLSAGNQPNDKKKVMDVYEDVYLNRVIRGIRNRKNVSKTTCDIAIEDLEEQHSGKLTGDVLIEVFKTHRTPYINN